MKEKSERVLYLDAIRGAATIAVIFLHIAAQNFYINPHEPAWNIFNLIESSARWGVPVFVMISGALFLEKDISIKDIFRKYVFRIVVAYAFWSAVYAFLYKYYNGNAAMKDILREFLIGHYHMWYLPMIAGLYLVIPLMKPIAQDELTEKWFIVLGCIITIVLPQISSLAPIFPFSKEFSDTLKKLIDMPQVRLVQGYSFYFILGHYLNKKRDSLVLKNSALPTAVLWLTGFLGWISTILLTKYLFIKTGKTTAYGSFTLNIFLESVFVFCLFQRLFYEKKQDRRTPVFIETIIRFLSKYSFGVYLVHPFFFEEIKRVVGVNTLSFDNTLIGTFLLFAAVFVLSYSTSILIREIPFIGKYIA